MISKILIANRGEIACRIIRTVKKLGLSSVAVYSNADANALHVSMADEAVHIGESMANASYLDYSKVIQAALATGADAIHPGYGFLSENAGFAKACSDNGLNFIGPPVASIEAMGSKSAAKEIMQSAGVPLLSGYHGDNQDPEFLQQEAAKIGYPVLLKAAAGGGGKGMRIVESADVFHEALAAAQREATNAFGDQLMLVEKYLLKPRHIEIQVFCDQLGNGVYLNERDCSIQRRHQKIIEEAPAPGMSDSLREKMGKAALECAQAIHYVGAGTVEFLLDASGDFYFMEMNTRLQVEHPVTEMITGFDLVEWQILVANGRPLPVQQTQVPLMGHSIEARIYAEDPDQEFLPQTGRLSFLATPAESDHVRIDTGVVQGDEISIYYDPMISKLIVWDTDRASALRRLTKALGEYHVAGVTTNISFLHALSKSAGFSEADLDTSFIQTHSDVLFSANDEHTPLLLAAATLAQLAANQHASKTAASDPHSPWAHSDAWRMNEPNQQAVNLTLDLTEGSTEFQVEAEHTGGNAYLLHSELGTQKVHGTVTGDHISISVDGRSHTLTIARANKDNSAFNNSASNNSASNKEAFTLFFDGASIQGHLTPPDLGSADAATDGGGLQAPMNGKIVANLVEVGETVSIGTGLVVMEAMKMEHTIKAQADGKVLQFNFAQGDLVEGGASLLDFETSEG
jgi:3-methylcrotonyl-CoA carboxylase alpha subunit